MATKTLKQLIDGLIWFDLPAKLKEILRRLSESIGTGSVFIEDGTNTTVAGTGTEEDPYVISASGITNITSTDESITVQETSSNVFDLSVSGGTQDLQSVTDEGNTTDKNIIITKNIGNDTFILKAYEKGIEYSTVGLLYPVKKVNIDFTPIANGNNTLKVPILTGGVTETFATQEWVRTPGYTVATLPASPTIGDTTYVTDANAPSYLAVVTGGGVVKCPVFYNGTNWVCH